MNGRAFLELARQLAAKDGEECRRTAVSRAYYGAYHVALEFVRSCDVIVPKQDVHVKLQWCLQQTGESTGQKDLTKAGSQLADLRTERNKADYELRDAAIAKIANVAKAVKHAEQIVEAISVCSADRSNDSMREQIRNYAQKQGWQLH